MEGKPFNTAKIVKGMFCLDCGWPIVHICCNDGMGQIDPYCTWDYWAYCSNKTCVNHVGQGWDQEDPSFSFRQP